MYRRNYHHQEAQYKSSLKLQCQNSKLKYIGVVDLVVWLHMLPGPYGICLPQSSEPDWSGYKQYCI